MKIKIQMSIPTDKLILVIIQKNCLNYLVTKYKEYCQRMIETNREAFGEFKKIHALYGLDQDKWQEKFNREGEKIVKIVKEWEDRLCQQSEKAGYSNYTGGLAEKFQAEIKKEFPLIDHVGLIIKRFTIKKISL